MSPRIAGASLLGNGIRPPNSGERFNPAGPRGSASSRTYNTWPEWAISAQPELVVLQSS